MRYRSAEVTSKSDGGGIAWLYGGSDCVYLVRSEIDRKIIEDCQNSIPEISLFPGKSDD